jgi:RHS repeat-associated protein
MGEGSFFENSMLQYDNADHLLHSEYTDFFTQPAVPYVEGLALPLQSVLPVAKHEVWPDGTTKTTTFTYDSGYVTPQGLANTTVTVLYGNQVTKNDYGNSSNLATLGPLLRTTTTNYLAFGNQAESSAAFQQNLISLPSSITEKDALTNIQHVTTYGYDESALVSGNASTSWDANPPNGLVRGNQTSVSRSLDTTGGVLTTHVGYTNTGMISSITLPSNTPYPDTTTTYGYSAAYQGALLTSVTNSLGQSKQYTYDPVTALLLTATDENSNTTTYSYYPDTRLQSIVYPPTPAGQPETDYAYPSTTEVDKSQKQSATSSIQQQTFYDGLGRSSETKLLNGCAGGDFIETDTGYDLLGRVSTVTNPHCGASSSSTDGITYHQYDAIGRPTIVTEPDSNTQSWAYNDDTTTFTDENNSSWSRTSDALGRLQTVIEPGGLQTVYGYDGFDNLTSVTQSGLSGTVPTGFVSAEAPKTRSFTYDSLNRLITSTNPETGTVCYGTQSGGRADWRPILPPPGGGGGGPPPPPPTSTCAGGYDAHGNLLAKTDANGVTQSFSYDALNRLLSKTASDNSVADSYTYDQTGAGSNDTGRLSVADHSGVAGNTFSYDSMGHITSGMYYTAASNGWQTGVAAVYDLAGNPTSITYPDGNQVTQTWDAAGRLSGVSSGSVNYISGLSYTPAGAASGFTLGNGVTQSNSYNNRLQPCHTTASTPALPAVQNGGNLLNRASFYSPLGNTPTNCGNEQLNNGNIQSIADYQNVGWSQSFHYDPLNRLTSAFRSDGGYNHSYNYDSFGNLAVTDNLNSNPVWDVDPATNQLLHNPVAGVTDSYGHPLNDFTYDYAGNMVSSGTYPIGHAYTYNALNQITAVDGGGTATYDYNGDDERAVKHTPNAWTQYIYFGGQPMAELGSDGTWTDYIYANGQKIAKVLSQKSVLHIGGTDPTPEGCGVSWVLVDPASSLSGVTVQTGDKLLAHLKMGVTTQGLFGLYLFSNTGDAGSWAGVDEISGQPMQWYSQSDGAWHEVEEDLSGYAGMYIAQLWLGAQGTPGAFDMWVSDAALVRANGSVMPIYNGQQPSGGMPGVCGETNLTYSAVTMPVTDPAVSTSYFVDDHLGTAQMELSGGGWPMWQGQFTPFGLELPDGSTNMEFKFTGKERDTESGLDYFGARYYGSSMGRFMSPDWSSTPAAIPFADLSNPQTLNLYSYVNNNPLTKLDPNGHDWFHVDNKWQWQKGHTYHDADGNATKDKGYAGLLVATKTGVNAQGATTFHLTLYDQNKIVGQGDGFSGNNHYADTGTIPDGNYHTLGRLDPPPTGQNPSSSQGDPPQIYGYQKIFPSADPYLSQVLGAYGPIRARLNPLEPGQPDGGYYLHGQGPNGFHDEGWTHGCLSTGRDASMIFYMQSHIGSAGVSVDTQVVKP